MERGKSEKGKRGDEGAAELGHGTVRDERHGRAARAGAAPPPAPDRAASSREAAAGRSAATGDGADRTKKL